MTIGLFIGCCSMVVFIWDLYTFSLLQWAKVWNLQSFCWTLLSFLLLIYSTFEFVGPLVWPLLPNLSPSFKDLSTVLFCSLLLRPWLLLFTLMLMPCLLKLCMYLQLFPLRQPLLSPVQCRQSLGCLKRHVFDSEHWPFDSSLSHTVFNGDKHILSPSCRSHDHYIYIYAYIVCFLENSQ